MSLEKLISTAVENFISEEDKLEISEFEELYKSLDESRKSHIIKLLLGKGVITKDKNGKLSKASPEAAKKALGDKLGK